MKKVKVSDKNATVFSHGIVKFISSEEIESASSTPSGTFTFINRLSIEESKSLPPSGAQMTSTVIYVVQDVGSESYLTKSASSQMGVAKFRETRLLPPSEIKRRTIEAIDRAEKKRKELLLHETDLESEL